ncbi:hypothetical protein N7491_007601 [Penicillium cf. griseofulvum]|uniref:Uncharacterized protein n=1 Tax=Penicillium cf. griseofulvum TaxID=2972120 RepID=A0A9W9IUX3_9EURO|nr:hypothetical protein N7472_009372 [Penicillium cf. griseofulvum]KAJ5430585.1 hypothetical protein N7491_007601 [Penicillium cf. griseofulvum]KAJ5435646.1 hypothetical protein N7445_006531 [Penicillium cf. griseofulvum]
MVGSLGKEWSRQVITTLAQIDARFAVDTTGDGTVDRHDSSSSRSQSQPLRWIKAPNRQDWLQKYVQKLVEDGPIPHSSISVVQNAPQFLSRNIGVL